MNINVIRSPEGHFVLNWTLINVNGKPLVRDRTEKPTIKGHPALPLMPHLPELSS